MQIALLEHESIVPKLTAALTAQGHTVTSFPTALPAIQACIGGFDLLITAIKLPWSAIDGLDAIRLIQMRRPAFPCLFLTIFDRDQIALMCHDLTNIFILQKPFSLQEFDVKLRGMLSSAPSTLLCKPRWPRSPGGRR